jgi:GDP-4-dehydro-6-deoxy-D-mannose reductase
MVVTGADGFVGRALVGGLISAGHDVIEMARSQGDVAELETWAGLPTVDHVFHLAGRSYVPDSWHDPASFINANVGGTTRALNYCRSSGAHFVFVSAYIYGIPKRLPIREDDPVNPNNPYALSKVLAERVCEFYAVEMRVPVTVVRPFNIFGPGQRREFLIPTIIEQVLHGDTIHVKDLSPRRDYLEVDDLVSALNKVVEAPQGHRVFNIGSGISYSVREMIDVIQTTACTELPIAVDSEPRINEIADVRADITRARTALGWQPRRTFAEGIERLVRASRLTAAEQAG